MSRPSDGAVRVLVPSGMLGAGFPPETLAHGIGLGADVIAVDAGSTDSGPYYLGTATAKTTERAVARDVGRLVTAARDAGIPLVIGSCGTSGTDAGVDWIARMVREALRASGRTATVARIYSEQRTDVLAEALAAGRIQPLPPLPPLAPEVLARCEHVVGLMGHEPIAEALTAGADIVLAGRATDTAVLAAYPLLHGTPPGPTWHAAKIAECGGLCTTEPTSGGVLVTLDAGGFEVEPLSASARCTPRSIAAHMLYENADPYVMREPAGVLDTTHATYTALDDRRVRVEGSLFTPAPHTIKLEGSAVAGYTTMSLVGVRDPEVLAGIDSWLADLEAAIEWRAAEVLDLRAPDYDVDIRAYGHNAVLGAREPDGSPPREVGVVLLVRAEDQATATAVAKVANPLMLHLPPRGMGHMPSFAFGASPAEVECGASYEFVLNHVLAVDTPTAAFRTEMEEVHGA